MTIKGISPKPESEWDDNTKALDLLYTGPQTLQTELQPGAPGSIVEILGSVTGIPDNEWDSSDTIGVGVEFQVGSYVQDNETGILYRCVDNTSNAAVWYKVVQEK